jgi:hypothetical protein
MQHIKSKADFYVQETNKQTFDEAPGTQMTDCRKAGMRSH